jgi:hypothetical protein
LVSIEISEKQERWTVQCCPPRPGFFDRLRGRWDPEPFERLLLAVDDVLKRSDRIRDIRWYPGFDVPEHLDMQVAYADPTLNHPLNERPNSSGDRLVTFGGRVLEWCWSPILFGGCIIAVIAAAAAGFIRVALVCAIPLVFTFSYTFAYLGVGLWIWGWFLFRIRRKQGSAFAYPGLAITLLGGAMLVYLALAAVGGFLAALLGSSPG